MDVADKIRLELEYPSGDDVYESRSPARDDDYRYRPDGTDHITRLKQGAWAQDFELRSESARTVRSLYLNSSFDEQRWAAAAIVESATDDNANVVGAVIVELGLEDRLPWALPIPLTRCLASGLTHALTYRPRTPTEQELSKIVDWAEYGKRTIDPKDDESWMYDEVPEDTRTGRSLRELWHTARDAQRFRQRREVLDGENPVVDRDRRELLGRLERLQISNDIRDLLHRSDLDAGTGDFKGALEKLRTFLERTCESCCRKSPRSSVQLPEDKAGGSIAPWKNYAIDAGLLTRKEGDVIQAVSSFLAIEGSHATGSKPEQFSVAKTTVIEWCLLLSGRVK